MTSQFAEERAILRKLAAIRTIVGQVRTHAERCGWTKGLKLEEADIVVEKLLRRVRGRKICARPRCGTSFIPCRPERIYCSNFCRRFLHARSPEGRAANARHQRESYWRKKAAK